MSTVRGAALVRHAFWLAWLLLLFAGCKTIRLDTLHTSRCDGKAELRFIERTHHMALVGDFRSYFAEFRDPPTSPWREVDTAYKRTPIYTKFYQPEDEFMKFPTFLRHPFIDYTRSKPYSGLDPDRFRSGVRQYGEWDFFVDPKAFSRDEFRLIRECIVRDLTAINRGLARAKRSSSDLFAVAPQLTAIVYRTHDYRSIHCQEHSLGPRFVCENPGVLLQLTPPAQVEVRVLARDVNGKYEVCDLIGLITDDEKEVYLRRSARAYANLFGADWLEGIGRCRYTDGKGFYDYFTPRMWDDQIPEPRLGPRTSRLR